MSRIRQALQAKKLPTRWFLIGTGMLLIIAAALTLVRSSNAGDQPGPQRSREAPPVSVSVETARLDAVPTVYEATGVVRSEYETELAAKVMGRITRLDVREGDRITSGQPLVWLDSRDLRAAVAQARAGAQAARVGVDAAVVTARMERSSSQARVDAARALVRQSEAAVESARARLDLVKSGPRKQERAQAALGVAQAKAALELAEADYARMKSLHEEGAVSRQQLDAARTQRDVARARYEAAQEALSMAEEGSRQEDIRSAEEGLRQAEAALDAARQGLRQAEAAALMADVRDQEIRSARAQVSQAVAAARLAETTEGYAVLYAPYDGVVARRMTDPGDMANPGVPLLVVHGGALRIEATVPESVLPMVRRDGTVEVELDAMAGRVLSGRVVEITPQGDPASHTFTVRAEIPRSSGAMAGMFGRVRIITGHQQQLTIPASSVRSRDGLSFAFVVAEDNYARLRLITTGVVRGGRSVVLSGLRAGEKVVVRPPFRLRDGAKVRF